MMIEWIQDILADQFWFSLLLAGVAFGSIMGAVAYGILLERKISAWTQDRFGPNRVGPLGLLQPIADGVKFLLKEDIVPRNVDRILFFFAPWMIFVVGMVGFAVIPWGGSFRWPWMSPDAAPLYVQVASVDIGLLYILAIASLGVYGVVLGGWASNNKYSFMGGMRAAAQMLSYEVPMGLMILVAVLTTGHLRLEEMISAQGGVRCGVSGFGWAVLSHPLAAFMLFVTALAEGNRLPFDLPECEQELVGGYHTEYSAMKLALFFLAEYAHMITASAFMVAMFFGGYLVPGWTWLNENDSAWAMVGRVTVFAVKIGAFVVIYMMIRWTLPRFRFDQLMRLAWQALVPIGMVLVILQTAVVFMGWPWWVALAGNVVMVVLIAWMGAIRRNPTTGRQLSLRREEGGLSRG